MPYSGVARGKTIRPSWSASHEAKAYALSPKACLVRRFQRVEATHRLKCSAGVSYPSVLRGRLLSCLATALSFAWLCIDRSVPFGKYCRKSRLVFSFVPRCHGECGSHRKTSMSVAKVNVLCPVISVQRSQVRERYSSFGSLRDCSIKA
jgi:hypothetical protein